MNSGRVGGVIYTEDAECAHTQESENLKGGEACHAGSQRVGVRQVAGGQGRGPARGEPGGTLTLSILTLWKPQEALRVEEERFQELICLESSFSGYCGSK